MKILPSLKSSTQITFYSSPWLFTYSGGRYEVVGFHTLFHLDDVLLCHLNMLLRTRWVLYSLISSPALKQTSNQNKLQNNLRGYLQKMPTRAPWRVLPLNSKHYLHGFLARTVGTRDAILFSKQGVPGALSQLHWLIHFLLCYISSGLFTRQKPIVWWFRRGYRKYCS